MNLTEFSKSAGAAVGMNVDRITVRGGKPLNGRIQMKGAKNLVTKAMVAALLGQARLDAVQRSDRVRAQAGMSALAGGAPDDQARAADMSKA